MLKIRRLFYRYARSTRAPFVGMNIAPKFTEATRPTPTPPQYYAALSRQFTAGKILLHTPSSQYARQVASRRQPLLNR